MYTHIYLCLHYFVCIYIYCKQRVSPAMPLRVLLGSYQLQSYARLHPLCLKRSSPSNQQASVGHPRARMLRLSDCQTPRALQDAADRQHPSIYFPDPKSPLKFPSETSFREDACFVSHSHAFSQSGVPQQIGSLVQASLTLNK